MAKLRKMIKMMMMMMMKKKFLRPLPVAAVKNRTRVLVELILYVFSVRFVQKTSPVPLNKPTFGYPGKLFYDKM